MNLFNFLKSKRNSRPQNIDEILRLASKDIAYRPLFYRTILETELYILIYPEDNLPKVKFTADGNTTIKIRTLSDGAVPVFTSEEKIYDNAVIKGQVDYVVMKGQAFFDAFQNPPRILLNPYSRSSKEFLPDEIKDLRTAQLYNIDEERTIKAETTINIGMPANYPTELVTTLKKYFASRQEVEEVYLALMHDLKSKESPHLIIGIKAAKNLNPIFEEMADLIKHHIPKEEFVDMINISDHGNMSKALKNKEYRIY